jgi:hypothetical protein
MTSDELSPEQLNTLPATVGPMLIFLGAKFCED